MAAYLHLFEKYYDTPPMVSAVIALLEDKDEEIKILNKKIIKAYKKKDSMVSKNDILEKELLVFHEENKKKEETIQDLLKSLDKFNSIEKRFNDFKENHMKKEQEKQGETNAPGETKENDSVQDDHYINRLLPLDSYNGISPNLCDGHKGINGCGLRVKVYSNGRVEKINSKNWTKEAHESFKKRYWT